MKIQVVDSVVITALFPSLCDWEENSTSKSLPDKSAVSPYWYISSSENRARAAG